MTACAPACSRGVGWLIRARGASPASLTFAIWVTVQTPHPVCLWFTAPEFSAMLMGDPCWSLYAAPLTSPMATVKTEGPRGNGAGASVSPSPQHLPPPRRVTSGSSGRRLAMTDLVQSRGDPSQSTSFAYICQTFCHFFKKRNTMRMNFKLLYV